MYVQREITMEFSKRQRAYNLIAVVGPRQAGKTTFLKEQMKGLDASYVLFDDPDPRSFFEEDIKKFEKQYLQHYTVSVLDEVQNCREAGRNLKYLADTGRKLWITSSSEIILGKSVLSYLVGRVSTLRLYPFSLGEFLAAKGQVEHTRKIMERSLWEHMLFGGYPKVILTDDLELKKTILRDLYDTMIMKDVARTFSIEDMRTFETVVKYFSVNIGSLISYEKVARDVTVSFQTLKKYLNAMEKSYIIVLLTPFFRNRTKEITKQPKVYFIDTGLRNSVAGAFPPVPDGPLFENYALTELLKLGFLPKYWRTKAKAEVDFVIEKENELIPIETKLKAQRRIERSLRSFIEAYRPKRAFVVSYAGEEGVLKVGDCIVTFTDLAGLRAHLKTLGRAQTDM